MFGGGNDTATVTPTAHQDAPTDNALADAPANGLTPGDAPAQSYDGGAFGTSADTTPAAAELTAPANAAPAATDTAVVSPAPVATPADDLLTSAPDDLISI